MKLLCVRKESYCWFKLTIPNLSKCGHIWPVEFTRILRIQPDLESACKNTLICNLWHFLSRRSIITDFCHLHYIANQWNANNVITRPVFFMDYVCKLINTVTVNIIYSSLTEVFHFYFQVIRTRRFQLHHVIHGIVWSSIILTAAAILLVLTIKRRGCAFRWSKANTSSSLPLSITTPLRHG